MIRLVLGGVLLCALLAGGVWLHVPGEVGIGSDDGQTVFVALEVAAGVVWAGVAWLVLRRRLPGASVAVVLLFAVGMRVAVLAAPPTLSTDIFRYVWDGRVQMAGHNPYMFLPNAPELAPLRDEAVYPHINRFDYAPTIYPPAAQALFAGVAAIWPTVQGMKAAIALLELGSVAILLVLLRIGRRPLYQVALYAWHPLPIWEFAGNGHVDGAALLFIASAVLAAVRLRPGWAGAALALAVLCKLLPVALAPALWRRWDWRAPLAGAAVVAAGYAAYIGAGWRVLGFLPGYAQEEGLGNGSGFVTLRLAEAMGNLPPGAARAYPFVCLAVLGALGVWVAFRPWPPDDADRVRAVGGRALVLGTALIAALSPHYPWYLAFLVWLGCLWPARSVGWLTLTAPLLYMDEQHDRVVWPALMYGPFALLALRDWVRAVRTGPSLRSPRAEPGARTVALPYDRPAGPGGVA